MVWFILKWVLSILVWPFAIMARPFVKKPKTYPPIPAEIFNMHSYDTVDEKVPLEEESSPTFQTGMYYPVTLGEILGARYQVHAKIRWDLASTTWIAQDLLTGQHVSLKVYISFSGGDLKFRIYELIRRARSHSWHEGGNHIRKTLDLFLIQGAKAKYWCLVQRPALQNLSQLQQSFPTGRVPSQVAKSILKQVLLGLDFLHRKCGIVHTDIQNQNIMEGLSDMTLYQQFVLTELAQPSARKFVNGHPIYTSRFFLGTNLVGKAVISEFRNAMRGDHTHNALVGTEYYRAPEVMFQADWTYPIDIWSFGITAWILVQGDFLFDHTPRKDYVGDECQCQHHYDADKQVAEMVRLLGPPPADFLKPGSKALDYFDPSGKLKSDKFNLEERTFESAETMMEEGEKALFLDFIRGMVQWRPEDRKTAAELLKDPWLNS